MEIQWYYLISNDILHSNHIISFYNIYIKYSIFYILYIKLSVYLSFLIYIKLLEIFSFCKVHFISSMFLNSSNSIYDFFRSLRHQSLSLTYIHTQFVISFSSRRKFSLNMQFNVLISCILCTSSLKI